MNLKHSSTRTPMRTLVNKTYNAKNALHYALEHNESSKVEFGENYNKLNETDSDGTTLRSSADQFSKEANDPSFPIEFSNAKYDKADFEKYANKTNKRNLNLLHQPLKQNQKKKKTITQIMTVILEINLTEK